MHANQSAENTKAQKSDNGTQRSSSHGCFALIWVRGISERDESVMLQDVEAISGVIAATFSRKDPHILLASYNPNITNSTAILRKVSTPEVKASIVGC